MRSSLVVPHKVNGTHIIFYNKVSKDAFSKKARKTIKQNQTFMNKKNGQMSQQSKHDQMFYLVKDDENKVNICVGGYAVSRKKFDTFEQAENYISQKPWEIIVNLSCIILTKNQNETNQKNMQDK